MLLPSSPLLLFLLFFSSTAWGRRHEHSDVTEILAAGLITRMLMEDFGGDSLFSSSLRHAHHTPRHAHHTPRHAHHTPRHAHPIPYPLPPRGMVHPRMVPHHPYHILAAMANHHQQWMMHQHYMQQMRYHLPWKNPGGYHPWGMAYGGAAESVVTLIPVLPLEELVTDEATLSALILNSGLLDDEEDQQKDDDHHQQKDDDHHQQKDDDHHQQKDDDHHQQMDDHHEEQKEEEHKVEEGGELSTLPTPRLDEEESSPETTFVLPRIIQHIVQRIIQGVEDPFESKH